MKTSFHVTVFICRGNKVNQILPLSVCFYFEGLISLRKKRYFKSLRPLSFCTPPGAEQNSIEKVCLRASELISCEWCSVRKLPVLFFQTTAEECGRLRTQLNMSREEGGQWYDCAGDRKSSARPSLCTAKRLGRPSSFKSRVCRLFVQSRTRSSSC